MEHVQNVAVLVLCNENRDEIDHGLGRTAESECAIEGLRDGVDAISVVVTEPLPCALR